MLSAYQKWLLKTAKELKTDLTPQRVALLERITNLRNEAAAGVFNPPTRSQQVIDNPELCGLIFLAVAENWLGWLLYDEGHEEQSMRHFEAYKAARQKIFASRKFTKEEKIKAFKVID